MRTRRVHYHLGMPTTRSATSAAAKAAAAPKLQLVLPAELLEAVLMHLDCKSLLRAEVVCRLLMALAAMVRSNQDWQALLDMRMRLGDGQMATWNYPAAVLMLSGDHANALYVADDSNSGTLGVLVWNEDGVERGSYRRVSEPFKSYGGPAARPRGLAWNRGSSLFLTTTTGQILQYSRDAPCSLFFSAGGTWGKTTFGEHITKPYAIAVGHDHIFVTDVQQVYVSVYEREGLSHVRSFGQAELAGQPCCIAVCSHGVVVGDCEDESLYFFSLTGELKSKQHMPEISGLSICSEYLYAASSGGSETGAALHVARLDQRWWDVEAASTNIYKACHSPMRIDCPAETYRLYFRAVSASEDYVAASTLSNHVFLFRKRGSVKGRS